MIYVIIAVIIALIILCVAPMWLSIVFLGLGVIFLLVPGNSFADLLLIGGGGVKLILGLKDN